MQNLIAQESQNIKKTLGDEYGINLNSSYSGAEVIDMLYIFEQESFLAIKEAYEDGYKQACVEIVPQLEYYKSLSTSLQKEVKTKRDLPVWTAPVFFVSGFIISFAIGSISK